MKPQHYRTYPVLSYYIQEFLYVEHNKGQLLCSLVRTVLQKGGRSRSFWRQCQDDAVWLLQNVCLLRIHSWTGMAMWDCVLPPDPLFQGFGANSLARVGKFMMKVSGKGLIKVRMKSKDAQLTAEREREKRISESREGRNAKAIPTYSGDPPLIRSPSWSREDDVEIRLVEARTDSASMIRFCKRCDCPVILLARLEPCLHWYCLDCASTMQSAGCLVCKQAVKAVKRLSQHDCIDCVHGCGKTFLDTERFDRHEDKCQHAPRGEAGGFRRGGGGGGGGGVAGYGGGAGAMHRQPPQAAGVFLGPDERDLDMAYGGGGGGPPLWAGNSRVPPPPDYKDWGNSGGQGRRGRTGQDNVDRGRPYETDPRDLPCRRRVGGAATGAAGADLLSFECFISLSSLFNVDNIQRMFDQARRDRPFAADSTLNTAYLRSIFARWCVLLVIMVWQTCTGPGLFVASKTLGEALDDDIVPLSVSSAAELAPAQTSHLFLLILVADHIGYYDPSWEDPILWPPARDDRGGASTELGAAAPGPEHCRPGVARELSASV
eukprot:g11232.t1